MVTVEDLKYDFLISSHCLEHCANPIKTLFTWKRVLKQEGIILLILPQKEFTFDHKRDITSFKHLLEDYENDVDENDLTHINEIIAKHDLNRDKAAGSLQEFQERSYLNFENRCLHHHVFDFDLLEKVLRYTGFTIEKKIFIKPFHQIIIGKKK